MRARQTCSIIGFLSIVSLICLASGGAIAQPEIQTTTQIPLVLVLWHDKNFGGTKREIIIDTPNLNDQHFNNQTSSVGVHPGPDYDAWKSSHANREPTVTLSSDIGGQGTSIVLRTGTYSDLKKLSINDKISSAYFTDSQERAVAPEGTAAPFSTIPFAIEMISKAGHVAWIVESTKTVKDDYGSEFTDLINFFVLTRTESAASDSVELCNNTYFDVCQQLSQYQKYNGKPYGAGELYIFEFPDGIKGATIGLHVGSIRIN